MTNASAAEREIRQMSVFEEEIDDSMNCCLRIAYVVDVRLISSSLSIDDADDADDDLDMITRN